MSAAVQIPVAIPMLLGNTTGGAREVVVSGATLQEALEDLLRQYPLLRVHLYDGGALRKHVLILFNGQNTRWFETLDMPVKAGDAVTILQAVSGG